ncbi:hypothetical protein Patl1_21413 [Pistacia atlantica]|uniref:Uncharacterized protein n=1 Tax=Pistacia atlantica TaxID=434234 RepID=A0ACC1BMU4_9ROSI|nr:hypothetical protein Patl1_21413 [Pistacia atlantica]
MVVKFPVAIREMFQVKTLLHTLFQINHADAEIQLALLSSCSKQYFIPTTLSFTRKVR